MSEQSPVEHVDVLLVEDDPDAQEVISELLRHHGYAVRIASDGHAALQLLERGLRPRVVLTDRLMPGMSGDDLARELAYGAARDVPVVILTAYPARARDLHARAVLQKPVDSEALIGVIEPICGNRRP